MKKEIIIVIGAICSGKDYYAKNTYGTYKHIPIGDIVRQILKTDQRMHDKRIDSEIVLELQKLILQSPEGESLIITGVRQLSIYYYLKQLNSDKYNVHTHYMSCPFFIRSDRFDDRKKKEQKDTYGITLQEFDRRDMELGLADLEKHIFDLKSTKWVKSY